MSNPTPSSAPEPAPAQPLPIPAKGGTKAKAKSWWSISRSWLEQNEILFKTVGWLALTIMALFVSCYSVQIVKQQNQLIDVQNKIMEGQNDLIRVQTDIARAQVSPKFVFESEDSSLTIKNVGDQIFDQKGEVVYFLEFTGKTGMVKRIRIKGVFADKQEGPWNSQNFYFAHSSLLNMLSYHERFEQYRDRLKPSLYVRLSYSNRAGERRTEQFVMWPSGMFPTPVAEAPRIDDVFDTTPFRSGVFQPAEKRKQLLRDAGTAFLEFLKKYDE